LVEQLPADSLAAEEALEVEILVEETEAEASEAVCQAAVGLPVTGNIKKILPLGTEAPSKSEIAHLIK
jgi:hypothetical protein